MKFWDYDDRDGSLEDAIHTLVERGKTIRCVTILKYAQTFDSVEQPILFPRRALILYS